MQAAVVKGLNLFLIHTEKLPSSVKEKHHLYYNIETNTSTFSDSGTSQSESEYLGYSSSKTGIIYLIKEKGMLNDSEKFLLDFGEVDEYEDMISAMFESSINKYVCVLHADDADDSKVIFNFRVNNIVNKNKDDDSVKFIREPAYFILTENSKYGDLFKNEDNWCFFDPKKLELTTSQQRRNGRTEPVAIIHLEPSSFDNLAE
jgi:hypothetical protein